MFNNITLKGRALFFMLANITNNKESTAGDSEWDVADMLPAN